jgi:cell wall-active antibiotic response 4TMS protein YvqF
LLVAVIDITGFSIIHKPADYTLSIRLSFHIILHSELQQESGWLGGARLTPEPAVFILAPSNRIFHMEKGNDMSQDQSPQPRQDDKPPSRPAWIAGGVLILIGIVFIVRNVTGFSLDNWWALFILIPALGSLVTSFQMYERQGRRFTGASRGPLVGGLFLLGLTAVFLFKLDWSRIWPFILILAGLGLLLSSIERKEKDDGGNGS